MTFTHRYLRLSNVCSRCYCTAIQFSFYLLLYHCTECTLLCDTPQMEFLLREKKHETLSYSIHVSLKSCSIILPFVFQVWTYISKVVFLYFQNVCLFSTIDCALLILRLVYNQNTMNTGYHASSTCDQLSTL